ncbi:hypothetical protein [Nocardia noduli]|uniref:hypothetical protein n=1 Tax=Nocardia noduli TaxID=2815722 RepID=UPI0020B28A5E|nr:hypothetical protein [Nocardia noduli]
MIDSNHHFEPPGAPMESRDTADILDLTTPAAWESWLADNHASSTGVWLKIAKKNSGSTTITIEVESVPTAGGSTRNRRKGGAK